jgi:hypothetical protein
VAGLIKHNIIQVNFDDINDSLEALGRGDMVAHGHPASRALLADATLDFQAALDNLCSARDALLKIAGAQRVTDTDE